VEQKGVTKFRYDHPWRERARDMRSRGLSWAMIARILGVSKGIVRYNVDENFRAKNIISGKKAVRKRTMAARAAREAAE
jgi:predicted transcriptional regulator